MSCENVLRVPMLLSCTVALIVGLLGGSYLPYFPVTLSVILASTATGLTFLEHRRVLSPRHGVILFGSLVAGICYWTVFGWAVTGHSFSRFHEREPVRIVGMVVESVRYAPERAVLVLAIASLGETGHESAADGRLRLTWRSPDLTVHQGDRVTVTARIRPPSGMLNPGGFDYGAYLIRHGIDGVASISGPGQVILLQAGEGLSQWLPWRVVDTWRDRIRQASIATLDRSALGIFLGMIIGETDYLIPEIRDLFMATGTVHILSISGSHLGLIAVLSYGLIAGVCRRLPAMWLLGLSRHITPTRLTALITVLPVIFYTLLAGSQVATVRSLVMILIFLLAVWLGREHQLLPALAGAAVLILLSDPRALFDISFQLSFLSVLAIALVVNWNRKDAHDDRTPSSWQSRAWIWGQNYLKVSGTITLLTLPLVAYHFNQIPWLGIAANLLVIPFAGFILVPIGLGSAVWLLIGGSETLPAASVNQALCDWLVDIVTVLANVPGAEWHVASPSVVAMIGFYLLLWVAWRSVFSIGIRRIGVMGVMLLLGWWMWSPRPWSDGEMLRVTFLDVGQGDACVIELPDHHTILIDGGAAYETLDMGRAVVGPFLWDQGIHRLDHVIGTHPQLDHVGGLAWTVQKFEVGRYWGNGLSRGELFYQRLQAGLRAHGLTEETAEAGRMVIDSGPCRLRILNPPVRDHVAPPLSVNLHAGSIINNLSIVTRLDCGPHSFLFTGDIEADAIARLRDTDPGFDARVIKVPHHGARSSLQLEWVARAHPETVVISVGRANPYGHPVPAVLAAYEQKGIQVLRTDRDGAVRVTARLSSPTFDVETARQWQLEPVRLGPAMMTAEMLNLKRMKKLWLDR